MAPADPASPAADENTPEARDRRRKTIEEWGWQLLRRWGVVFKDLLIREQGAPAWWELVQHYRRLEARGEIRGGRFIQGVGGEQFALPDTVRELRDLRESKGTGDKAQPTAVVVSGADPLNLVGILTSHPRVPSTAGNRILYWNGRPAAHLVGGEVTLYPDCPSAAIPTVRQRFELSQRGVSPSEVEVMAAAIAAVPVPPPLMQPPAAETKTPPAAEGDAKRVPARVLLRTASRGPRHPPGAPRPRFS